MSSRIERVWESDGSQPHRLVYEASSGLIETSCLVSAAEMTASGQIIEKLLSSGRRTIEDVRAMVILSSLP